MEGAGRQAANQEIEPRMEKGKGKMKNAECKMKKRFEEENT